MSVRIFFLGYWSETDRKAERMDQPQGRYPEGIVAHKIKEVVQYFLDNKVFYLRMGLYGESDILSFPKCVFFFFLSS